MIFCDTHCDYLYNYKKRKEQSSIKLYKKSDLAVQVFAIFLPPNVKNPILKTTLQVLRYKALFFRKNLFIKDLEYATNPSLNTAKKHRIYPILALEGMKPTNYSLSILKALYSAGIKSVSLTWNEDNKFAGGALSYGELKHMGKKALDYISTKQMCLDVSHLNEKSFYQALDYYKGPVMASHSCCSSINDHKRNLSDAQVKMILDRNGFIGINFYPDFLIGKGRDASSKDIANHVDHVCQIGGINNVGFGSDFSGINKTPVDMQNCTTFYKAAQRLAQMNYNEDEIKKICYSNFYDFIIQFI
jgi:membrane dipeptidase